MRAEVEVTMGLVVLQVKAALQLLAPDGTVQALVAGVMSPYKNSAETVQFPVIVPVVYVLLERKPLQPVTEEM